jgi:hypothetical protein
MYKNVLKSEQVRLQGLPGDQQIRALTEDSPAPPPAVPSEPPPNPSRQDLHWPFQRRGT